MTRHNLRPALAGLIIFLATVIAVVTLRTSSELVDGIIWQPTNDYPAPQGYWHWLGTDTLLVQWSLNDGMAWVPTPAFDAQPTLPDWSMLSRAPWAERLILGLASRMQLEAARQDWTQLASQGERLLGSLDSSLESDGWYAPLEFSPDWSHPEIYSAYLAHLPEPRYVSAYGGYERSPKAFAEWVAGWLPEDATLLLQDGVGAAGQTPQQARARADALIETLGEKRIIMVLEAFQPDGNDAFRSASMPQLISQLRAYRGLSVYVFSARHLTTGQVIALRLLAPWLN